MVLETRIFCEAVGTVIFGRVYRASMSKERMILAYEG